MRNSILIITLKKKMTKSTKGIGVIKRLSKMLPQCSLLTIYTSFVMPHIDYDDIIYDQPNKGLCQKIETVQYNAAPVITGSIKGASQVKLYNEIGLESLEFRRWFTELCLFYKIKKTGLPEYLFNMIPQSNHQHNPRPNEDVTIRWLELSHLNEHKFKHHFQDCVNSLCSCSLEIEFPSNSFLHCHHFTNIRATLLDDLQSVDRNIPSFSDNELVDLLLYGSPNFNLNQNNKILSSSISFIIKSERFSGSLF